MSRMHRQTFFLVIAGVAVPLNGSAAGVKYCTSDGVRAATPPPAG